MKKMKKMTHLRCRAAVLKTESIDTDRIIPARFLTTTSSIGLGQHLFADWPPGRAAASQADLLIVGPGFGCGSSREHAVWALMDAGTRAVVSSGLADIFHANALRNGLVPVVLGKQDIDRLISSLERQPDELVEIDLVQGAVSTSDFRASFPLDAFARYCMIHGLDELGYLLEQVPAIETFEQSRPPRVEITEGTS